MTAQEIFDKVTAHLRKQGKASVDIDGSCAYRGEGGTSCAVGCLIPDEMYDEMMEGGAVHAEEPKYPELYKAIDVLGLRGNVGLLTSLQRAHDETLQHVGMPSWENYMANIARSRGLTYTPPTT